LLQDFSEAISTYVNLQTSIGTQTVLVIPGGRGMYNKQSLLLQISDPDIGTLATINEISGASVITLNASINIVEGTHKSFNLQNILGRVGDLPTNIISVEMDQYADPATTTAHVGVDILLDGGSILNQIISCKIDYNESSVHNSIDITSHNNALFRKAKPTILYGEGRLVVKINSRVIPFLVERLSGTEQSFSIFGRGLSAKGDLPYVDNIDVSLETEQPAKDLAESFLSESSLIWETVEWNMPIGFEFKGSPIAGVQTIASVVGAIVRGADDGTIVVRNPIPVRPIDLPNSTPNVNYDRVDDIISAPFTSGLGTGEAEIEIEGYGGTSNLPTIEVEERKDTSQGVDVFIRVYWVDTKPKILDDLVTAGLLTDLGNKTTTVSNELLAIENGEGTTKYPIFSLSSATTIGALSPGILSYTQYSKTLKGDDGAFAVIKVAYVTAYERYLAYRHNVEAILAAVFFNETAGISAKIIFSDGGNPAKTISDSNITTIEAAKQRGITYLDTHKYNFKQMDITVPYNENALDGNIAYINDAEIECLGNFHITQSRIDIDGPKITNMLKVKQWQVS
jgi:hypothetical protein